MLLVYLLFIAEINSYSFFKFKFLSFLWLIISLVCYWWLIISLVCSIVPSGSVSNLHARDLRSTTIELSWDPVDEIDRNGIILSYNIYYRLFDTSDPYMRMPGVIETVSDMCKTVSVKKRLDIIIIYCYISIDLEAQ